MAESRPRAVEQSTTHPRVLVAADYYAPAFRAGGRIRSLTNLIEQLGDEISFTIVTRDRDLGSVLPESVLVWRGTKTYRATIIFSAPGRRAIELIRTARQRFDVLYLNSLFSKTFGILPLIARRVGLIPRDRLLIAVHGELHDGALGLHRRRKVAYLRAARAIGLFADAEWHASNDDEASQIRRWIGDRALIYVAPNLLVIPSIEQMPAWPKKNMGSLRLVFVSRLHPKKNLDYAFKILSDLPGDITLDVYGPIEDPRYWAKCLAQLSSLSSDVRVTYRGVITPVEVAEVFARHDVFFFPTRGENFGNVVGEALAAGCPPLVSDQTPWDVASRGAGWSIPLDQPQRYRETLIQLLNMEDREFTDFRIRARQYAEEVQRSAPVLRANRRLFGLVDAETDERDGP
jgi:glycosyltransferase involved in cell wall biosynthesis